MSDARLRELYAQAVERRGAPDRSACVAPDRILEFVEQRGPEAQRLTTLDHVMACPSCRADYDLLRSVVAPPAARPLFSRPMLAAAATVLVTVAGAAAVVARMRPPDDDVLRGSAERVEVAAPVRAPGGPLTLVWRPVPGALRYEAEVTRDDGTAVFSGSTRDTVLAVPAGALSSGAPFSWWVRAHGADGSVRRSPLTPLAEPR